ncbi:DUF2017 domain-containing protein [Isoptericola sp. NEAU-Y5]|uniref:DUF2017 domain-containing protein n=1 Tax=Isoptericola luteus TaxID=2879484 RepID=A0ABS7ZFY2_9MICO|nr:DUF2017 family protein [Isoptericola sp. NEAU-Y5]MCA5893382.1 DUF2017 domain-containing protein [Isoptericola sp. NEAU-Y5]
MTPFRAAPAGYVARWDAVEREVLARVARDVSELLRAESGIGPDLELSDGVAFTGVARVPHDPAVQRLLPDAHRDDPDVAAEFRHLTQTDLAARKAARLEAFAQALDPQGGTGTDEVLVERQDAEDFAGALTDVRLVLAERLALEDDDDVTALHDEVVAGLVDPDDDGPDDDHPDDDHPDDGGPDDGVDAGPGELGDGGFVLAPDERRYWGGVFVAAGFAQESLMDELLADLRAGR